MNAPCGSIPSCSELDQYLGTLVNSNESKGLEDPHALLDALFGPAMSMSGHRAPTNVFDPRVEDNNVNTLLNESLSANTTMGYDTTCASNSPAFDRMWTESFYYHEPSGIMFPMPDMRQAVNPSYHCYPTYAPSLTVPQQTPTSEIRSTAMNGGQSSHLPGQHDSSSEWDFLFDGFGSTQVAPYNPVTQIEPIADLDELLSEMMDKGSALEPVEQSETTQPSFDINEWLILANAEGKRRRPYLHEFFRLLLDKPAYLHIAYYVDKRKGIFKIRERNQAATLWQRVKGRNSTASMTYDKLARAIRYYYPDDTMRQSSGRFTFRFGLKSGFGTQWLPASA